jgi:ABC-2 type transport system ATP-binding protein
MPTPESSTEAATPLSSGATPTLGTTAEPVIETHALTKVYPSRAGDLTAVDGLDLTVRAGEIFGLLGPNGAGKTTTVGMLTTRVIPTNGEARVGGIDVIRHPTAAKQVIGVLPQTNTLDRSLDVFENLYFHGRYFGMGSRAARQRTDELLERFRLADRSHTDTLELSGGMAQRLMVARAVMHRPQVLFLDEPTAGLDPQSRLALWEAIGELHDAGETILVTTHYMEEADQLCDRVAIMDHGRILALDTPAALKESTGADTEIRLRASGDPEVLATDLASLDWVRRTQVTDNSVHVFLRGIPGALARVINHVDAAGFTVHDVGITEPTLESVFISLTGRDLRE